jgi:sRNA-binding protein
MAIERSVVIVRRQGNGIGRNPNQVVPRRVYAHRRQYQVALAQGGTRYGLDGLPAGEVAPDQAACARARLEQRDVHTMTAFTAAAA